MKNHKIMGYSNTKVYRKNRERFYSPSVLGDR